MHDHSTHDTDSSHQHHGHEHHPTHPVGGSDPRYDQYDSDPEPIRRRERRSYKHKPIHEPVVRTPRLLLLVLLLGAAALAFFLSTDRTPPPHTPAPHRRS